MYVHEVIDIKTLIKGVCEEVDRLKNRRVLSQQGQESSSRREKELTGRALHSHRTGSGRRGSRNGADATTAERSAIGPANCRALKEEPETSPAAEEPWNAAEQPENSPMGATHTVEFEEEGCLLAEEATHAQIVVTERSFPATPRKLGSRANSWRGTGGDIGRAS
jgi:hypothetical protein